MEAFERYIRLVASPGSRVDSCGRLYDLSEFPTLTLWKMGDTSDITSLLAKHRPRIVVDEEGGELLTLSSGGSPIIFLSGGDHLWRGCAPVSGCHDGSATK